MIRMLLEFIHRTSAPEAVLYGACIVLVVVPAIFIRHGVYEDGVVGRSMLGALILSSCAILWEGVMGEGYNIDWAIALLAVGMAGFICWHLWRFHRRVLNTRMGVAAPCGRSNAVGCPFLDKRGAAMTHDTH